MDKCPFCGAELNSYSSDYVVYKCGTSGYIDDLVKTGECYEKEIANFKERLEKVENLLERYMEANQGIKIKLNDSEVRLNSWRKVKPLLRYPKEGSLGESWINAILYELKDLGEI